MRSLNHQRLPSASILLLLALLLCCQIAPLLADTFRIGRRVAGDSVVLKKVLLSVPSAVPTNHTVIYEYRATKAVSCIEYHIENLADEPNRVHADISFTGEYSLAAHFELLNITELVIIMSIYGFDQFSVPLNFRPILVPQFLLSGGDGADGGSGAGGGGIGGAGGTPKFGLGFRRPADELVYFYTQSTTRTDGLRNHSLVFETVVEHYITYVCFAVDSKTAGVTFLLMTEHEFRGIVYDTNARQLFANLYVYGYKKDKLPAGYAPLPADRQPAVSSAADAAATVPFDGDELIQLRGRHAGVAGKAARTDGDRNAAERIGVPLGWMVIVWWALVSCLTNV